MDGQQLLSGLIETYRLLNMSLRGMDENRLHAAHGQAGSVQDIVQQLRDDELQFSQGLKERISGVPMADIFTEEAKPTTGMETDQDTTAMMIAQFGTARESTLAMLRAVPDADWDTVIENGKSIRARVSELLENDQRQLGQIEQLMTA
jgi:hypothetical protein